MKNNLHKTLVAFLASSVIFSGAAFAAVPNELIYEGRMLSKTGEVLADSYVLRFSFWKSADFVSSDISSGSIATTAPNYAGWQEVIPVSFNELGHFSVILGKTNSLAALDFDKYKFLQVEIKKASDPDSAYKLMDIDGDNGVNATDRKTVASVPYARHAQDASSSTASNFIIDANNQIAGSTSGNISLQFGAALDAFLKYDVATDRFIFTDDVEVQGNIIVSGKVDGVDVSELANTVSTLENSLQAIDGTSANTFILNEDNSSGDVSLQFGAALQESLKWDPTNSRFVLSDDLHIDGNITLPGTVDGVDVSELKLLVDQHSGLLAAQSGSLTTINNTLADYANQLAQNSTAHTSILNQITALGDSITEQAGDLEDLAQQVDSNTDALNALTNTVNGHTTTLASHTAQIAGLISTITTQTGQIADLTQQVNENTQDLIDLTAQVGENTADISALEVQVAFQANQLANHATQLATHANEIATLTVQIAQNTANIAALQAQDVIHSVDIAALKAKDIVLSNDIIALKAKDLLHDADIADLKVKVAANTTDIIELKAKVDTNTANIADLKPRVVALETDMAEVKTIVGDGDYTSDNIISFGDDLTEAISKIDAFLGTPKSQVLHIPLAEAVVNPDGTDNHINVYHATEGGTNPHQFLKAISSKPSLQDMGLQFKIQLPKDLSSIKTFKMFYKAEGTAAQNSFDISLKNASGTAAFTETNLSNTSWTPLTKIISSSFAPAGGEFIYITLTPRSMNSKAMLMGDMIIEYETTR